MESTTSVVYESENLTIKCIVLGLLSNNVYIIESDGATAIVDPSCRADDILKFVGNHNVDKILLTHYHFDHVGAAREIKRITGAKTYASTIDAALIEDPNKVPIFHRKIDQCGIDIKLNEDDIIEIGSSSWKVIETPGHTQGGICFYNKDAQNHPILISGDTLFKCSCGRCDFIDSSIPDMKKSLLKLSELPDSTLVLPGHQDYTRIKDERNYALNKTVLSEMLD